VVFHYFDPYLNRRIYLHTDLKSYAKSSLKLDGIRKALRSLATSVECAAICRDWSEKYVLDEKEKYEVRGLLFVANHDNKAPKKFDESITKIDPLNLGVARMQFLHVLGPMAISRLFSIAADIKIAIQDGELSQHYRFFYPDLTLWKRHTADDERIGATIEMLMSPYFILRHGELRSELRHDEVQLRRGSLVYYSREGSTVEEFTYLLDSLLRFQLVNAHEQVRIRVYNAAPAPNMKSNFEKAKIRYCADWGFEGSREEEIMAISIDTMSRLEPNYSPDIIGWTES
jgi:hypothetical protein